MAQLCVNFVEPPSQKLQYFIKFKLKFVQLTEIEKDVPINQPSEQNTEQMDISDDELRDEKSTESKINQFFYCNEDYFRGLFVRINVMDMLNLKMKAYFR